MKKRGLRVIRAVVTPVSRLLGRTAHYINFRDKYKAAIVAVQRGGKNMQQALSTVVFEAGDVLILQASDDSPLLQLKPPTDDFYRRLAEEATAAAPKLSRPSSYKSLVNLVKFPSLSRRPSQTESDQNSETSNSLAKKQSSKNESTPVGEAGNEEEGFFVPPEAADRELQDDGSGGPPSIREMVSNNDAEQQLQVSVAKRTFV